MKVELNEEMILNCMHCGFCLPACPTYREMEKESASPRGRIALMRSVQAGQMNILDIAENLDACLGCRACEPACPAGVTYGAILEQGRANLTEVRPTPWPVKMAYKYVFGTPGGISFAGKALWFYQKSGLRALAHSLDLVKAVGGQGLADMEASVPEEIPSPSRRNEMKRLNPAVGQKKYLVGFFLGCVSDIVFFETNMNAIAVLTRAGCEVEVAPGQGCCGAVHSHAGEHELAMEQAKRNIAAFEEGHYDYIVSTAGGCGAALREYHKLLADDPEWAQRAARFSAACRDFSELIAQLDPLPLGPMAETFTYQDSCHLKNVQKVSEPPRQLLRSIPGAKFVELPDAGSCCGAAGTYAISKSETSDAILDRKAENVRGTGATTVVVANPPCHLEMIEGVRRAGLKVKVRHIADILAESLQKGQ